MAEHTVRTGVIAVPGELADLIDVPGISPSCPECLLPMAAGASGWECDHDGVPHTPA